MLNRVWAEGRWITRRCSRWETLVLDLMSMHRTGINTSQWPQQCAAVWALFSGKILNIANRNVGHRCKHWLVGVMYLTLTRRMLRKEKQVEKRERIWLLYASLKHLLGWNQGDFVYLSLSLLSREIVCIRCQSFPFLSQFCSNRLTCSQSSIYCKYSTSLRKNINIPKSKPRVHGARTNLKTSCHSVKIATPLCNGYEFHMENAFQTIWKWGTSFLSTLKGFHR